MSRLRPARYASLPDSFYVKVQPKTSENLRWIDVNTSLSKQFGLNNAELNQNEILTQLTAQDSPIQVTPIATIYAGHQFGIYSSRLGDGRAVIVGDLQDEFNQWWEVQLKGAGPTPFSRGLDGKASLESCIREYLASEALAALGLPSTRALGILAENNIPGNSSIEANAILVRCAPCHIRFGHFEYFHNQERPDLVKTLADFLISNHYPELVDVDEKQRYLQLLYVIAERTASLVAKWQAAGFVHSVMNTDNMSVLGITIDYGPYAFMEQYMAGFLPNASDDQGRYAFDQQAEIGRWNCLALAEALIELLSGKVIPANILRRYRRKYSDTYLEVMRKKLGLLEEREEDTQLIQNLLELMSKYKADYPLFFRMLSFYPSRESIIEFKHMFSNSRAFSNWLHKYEIRLVKEDTSEKQRYECMLQNNPKYVLRKHLLDESVEAAAKQGDFSKMKVLLKLIQSPYDEHPEFDRLSWPIEQDLGPLVSQAS